MFRKFSKKRLLTVTGVTALALAGIAFAFFSSAGSGSGSAGVADPQSGLTLSGTISGSLGPGDTKAVSLKASNSNSSAVTLHNVSGTVSVDQTHLDAGCAASNFSFTGATEDQSIAANASNVALTNDGSVSMPTSSSNQDVCKGATLTLNLSSN